MNRKSLKFIVLGALIGFAGGYLFFGIYSGLGDQFTEKPIDHTIQDVIENWDFYKNIGYFAQTLDSNLIESIGEEFDEDGSEFQKLVIGLLVYMMNQDDEVRISLDEIRMDYDRAQEKKEELSDDSVFEKNTSCASLVPGIRSEINSGNTLGDTNRTFDYIFYSGTKNTCLYSVSSKEESKSGAKAYKLIYDASSNNQIGRYLVFVSYDFEDYAGNSGESFDERVLEETGEYIKFVLENSYYDSTLLDDSTYINDGL